MHAPEPGNSRLLDPGYNRINVKVFGKFFGRGDEVWEGGGDRRGASTGVAVCGRLWNGDSMWVVRLRYGYKGSKYTPVLVLVPVVIINGLRAAPARR